jgi:hypothetical protein
MAQGSFDGILLGRHQDGAAMGPDLLGPVCVRRRTGPSCKWRPDDRPASPDRRTLV